MTGKSPNSPDTQCTTNQETGECSNFTCNQRNASKKQTKKNTRLHFIAIRIAKLRNGEQHCQQDTGREAGWLLLWEGGVWHLWWKSPVPGALTHVSSGHVDTMLTCCSFCRVSPNYTDKTTPSLLLSSVSSTLAHCTSSTNLPTKATTQTTSSCPRRCKRHEENV